MSIPAEEFEDRKERINTCVEMRYVNLVPEAVQAASFSEKYVFILNPFGKGGIIVPMNDRAAFARLWKIRKTKGTKIMAREYHVAKCGSDKNNGTRENPFLTPILRTLVARLRLPLETF